MAKGQPYLISPEEAERLGIDEGSRLVSKLAMDQKISIELTEEQMDDIVRQWQSADNAKPVEPSPRPDYYRTEYEDYRHKFEHEHNLIDRKITWLLTSQTILFASLGFSLQAPALLLVRIMAGVGLAICIFISVGLVGNIIAKRFVYSDYDGFISVHRPKIIWGRRVGKHSVEFGVRAYTTSMGIFADLAIPFTFAIAWLLVFVFSADIVQAAEAGSTAR